MIEWGGWKYDEDLKVLREPGFLRLARREADIVEMLLRARGDIVFSSAIEKAFRENGPVSNPDVLIRTTVSRVRAGLSLKGLYLIDSVYGKGYRAIEAGKPRMMSVVDRRAALVDLLKDQFEATGPHARAVVREIEEMFAAASTDKEEIAS